MAGVNRVIGKTLAPWTGWTAETEVNRAIGKTLASCAGWTAEAEARRLARRRSQFLDARTCPTPHHPTNAQHLDLADRRTSRKEREKPVPERATRRLARRRSQFLDARTCPTPHHPTNAQHLDLADRRTSREERPYLELYLHTKHPASI
jgi:hypothetical protein